MQLAQLVGLEKRGRITDWNDQTSTDTPPPELNLRRIAQTFSFLTSWSHGRRPVPVLPPGLQWPSRPGYSVTLSITTRHLGPRPLYKRMHPSTISSSSRLTAFRSSSNIRISPDEEGAATSCRGSDMGALVPQQAAVLLAALLAVTLLGATAWKAEAAAPPAVVVGSVKCLDCSPSDVDAFKGTCNICNSPACTIALLGFRVCCGHENLARVDRASYCLSK